MSRERLPFWAVFGFIILSLFGVILRYLQLFPLPGFNYMFLLHAHSHFAFAGWMFFALAFLITGVVFDTYTLKLKYLFIATIASSYGMLISFSFQGYKAISIAFSTLFILVTYRFTYLVWKERRKEWKLNTVSTCLIWGSLVFLCLSSLGPFALGPIMSTGLRGSPLYQNAIYYYLHFQMNGWMLLAALGLLANSYLIMNGALNNTIKFWLFTFIISNLPLFALFTLWSKPAEWIWVLALLGSIIQLISWVALCRNLSNKHQTFSFLVNVALLAITLKSLMQVLVCIPLVSEWVFLNRNLIIGYVHLITLGCITPLVLDQFFKRNLFKVTGAIKKINLFYVGLVILYLILLFLQPLLSLFGITIPYFQMILLVISFGFLFVGLLFLYAYRISSSK